VPLYKSRLLRRRRILRQVLEGVSTARCSRMTACRAGSCSRTCSGRRRMPRCRVRYRGRQVSAERLRRGRPRPRIRKPKPNEVMPSPTELHVHVRGTRPARRCSSSRPASPVRVRCRPPFGRHSPREKCVRVSDQFGGHLMTTILALRGPERRRRWVVVGEGLGWWEESLAPGAVVAGSGAAARRVYANLLHRWRP